jgi:CheY-like chemotaxis protein
MTHELKTPINAILGMSDLLKMTNIDAEQKEYIEILETSTTYLQKLVSDILDISKIESGEVEIKKTTFNLLHFLLEIVNTFEYSLTQKNIKLKIDYDFKANLEVVADKVILQQILSNLLSNAEKFTQAGSVSLSVTLEAEWGNEIKLKFSVSDTGIGIADDMKEVIFEKFKQLPSLKLHKSQGSGLGLNIVKQLLALQNSKIEVLSVKGEGSTFFFDMVFEKGSTSQRLVSSKPNLGANTHFSSLQVLVVEDNDLNQKYVNKVLNKWSVNFAIVSSGEEAMLKFAEMPYDLILMDLQLPGISGLETAAKLRALYKEEVFTIIAMTAVVTSNIEVEILKNGINDIIRKPFSIADLYDKMQLYFSSDILQITKRALPFHESLDISFLKQFYEEDKDYALSVFESFREKYLLELKLLIENIGQVDYQESKKRLHSIKPAFKMVGLTSIERDIEQILTDDSIDKPLLPNWDLAEIEHIIDAQIGMLKRSDFT